jgi:hypothetical protein
MQAEFNSATGVDETAIGVYSFNTSTDSSFTLENEFNLSSNNSALGTFETGQTGAKSLTMDSRGDLFYSVYSGGSLAASGESIYEIKNAGWSNTGWGFGSLGVGSGTSGYTYSGSGTAGLSGDELTTGAGSIGSETVPGNLLHFDVPQATGVSFSSMDAGMGVPISAPTPLRWAGLASNSVPTDASGTWDTGTTANWIGSGGNTTWAENDAAEFGAGSGTGASPVAVTIPSGVTHTVGRRQSGRWHHGRDRIRDDCEQPSAWPYGLRVGDHDIGTNYDCQRRGNGHNRCG